MAFEDVIAGRKQWEVVCGDCLEVMRGIPDGSVDAVITDPPYGISLNTDYQRYGSNTSYQAIEGDTQPPELAEIFRVSAFQVIWGANNWPWLLPRITQAGWLCWDKRCCEAADRVFGAPFELAWTSRQRYFKIYRIQHGGVINADGANQKRVHPTQKPIRLFTAILLGMTQPDDIVIDPYMGSGTTGVACMKTGRRFIGIEIDPHYCWDIAYPRIAEAAMQPRLIV